MRTVSVKVASAVIAGLGLTAGAVGLAGAQVTGGVGTTGEDSHNEAMVASEDNRQYNRDVNVSAENNNPQSAVSGDATVDDGDDDGTATSGGAGNTSTFSGGVTVGQGGSGAGSSANAENEDGNGTHGSAVSGTIEGTGEDSDNYLDVTHTDNRTWNSTADVNVVNNNTQNAVSGAATVQGGENGGSATSGSAANTSSSTFNINVQQ